MIFGQWRRQEELSTLVESLMWAYRCLIFMSMQDCEEMVESFFGWIFYFVKYKGKLWMLNLQASESLHAGKWWWKSALQMVAWRMPAHIPLTQWVRNRNAMLAFLLTMDVLHHFTKSPIHLATVMTPIWCRRILNLQELWKLVENLGFCKPKKCA
jgi:hypothetical protein